jgi:hypothetical protein
MFVLSHTCGKLQARSEDFQENRKVQREGVRSMISGSVHAGFLTVLAEK